MSTVAKIERDRRSRALSRSDELRQLKLRQREAELEIQITRLQISLEKLRETGGSL